MANKVWTLKFVAGNPQMFSEVRSQEGLAKKEALGYYETINKNSPAWRVWVEHHTTGKRLVESQAEIDDRTNDKQT